MISKYNNFMSDLLLERIINETYIYYSPDLERVLRRSNNEISKDLLSISGNDIKPDITFVNLEPGKDEYLSFTTARNAGNNLSKIWSHTPPDSWFDSQLNSNDLDNIWKAHKSGFTSKSDVYSKSRNSLRIGKFINKVFPGKYNAKQIEEFVNSFKASLEGGDKFEIVEGDEIAKWYNYQNYLEVKGQLGNSCMKEKSSYIFKIYTKNPEVCRMLILKDGDKITGRALIWKLSSIKKDGKEVDGIEYFLDRQYTIDESDVVKFRNYAVEQGWAYKAVNNHHSLEPIIFNGEKFNAIMTVQLKEVSDFTYDYVNYPYVDTFRRYDPSSGILHNDEDSDNEGDYILHNTDGGYDQVESGVWSEWHSRRIPEEYAVWSEWADSYLDSDSAIMVSNGSRRNHGWYPDVCDDVVWDEWDEIFIHVDDAVYSEAYGYSILDDNAVQATIDIDVDGEPYGEDWFHRRDDDIIELDQNMVWYDILSYKFRSWMNNDFIVSDVMTRNYKDEWIPKMYSTKTYKLLEPKGSAVDITGIEYLTEIDADILGYKVDKGDIRINDQFQYHRDIEDILEKIYKRASSEWTNIKKQISGNGQLRFKFSELDEEEYIESLEKKRKYLEMRLDEIENDDYIETDFEISRNND
jgi:hypothetical protein